MPPGGGEAREGPGVLDALVVGAGQAGLAAGYHLKRAGLSFEILEARGEPGGSWPGYYDSLTLFSPARYSGLPGKAVLRVAPLLSESRRVAGGRPLPVSLDPIASPGRGVFVDPIERRPILGEKKRVLILCTLETKRNLRVLSAGSVSIGRGS
jgi:hypothetical protein